MKKIRVRFAPSPTGYLHIGGARTALYNFLFARKNKGDFILRIEDTDRTRLVEGSLEGLLKSLKWLGFNYGEGPFIQSDRLEIYRKYAEELVKLGKAYYCFCEPERLKNLREEQVVKKQAPMYDQYCLRNINEEQINKNLKENCPHTIRLKVPKNETIEFTDIIRGKIKIETNTIDDQILLKSDGFPTYHLANVVDDHLMKITHVIRGEEWISSTPKHILLYKAFGWEIPDFAHLPLLLNADKSKLSKRQGDVALEDYIKKGYLKEALINFIALLGWNPGEGSAQEIFTLEELIEKFDLKKVHKAGAVFDLKKLDWLNSQYIRKLSIDELYEKSFNFFKEKRSEDFLKKVLTIEQERLNNMSEVGERNRFFFQDIAYDKNLLRWKEMSDAEVKESLKKAKTILETISEADWTKEFLEKTLLEAAGDKKGDLLWPLRVALTGESKSPPPGEVAWVLGRSESIKRLEQAIKLL